MIDNKEIKIEVPKGYEIDRDISTFEKIVFKKKEKELPKSWEELEIIKGYWVDVDGSIEHVGNNTNAINDNKNVFPTREYAEAVLALAQLLQLRERYIGDWIPNWTADTNKYCAISYKNSVCVESFLYTSNPLSFPHREIALEYYRNFKDLLEIAKPLL